METVRRGPVDSPVGPYAERWVPWPVFWQAVWVGALAALATALVIGLIGMAVGAHQFTPGQQVESPRAFRLGTLLFSVIGAVLAFGVGGWVTSKIAGFRQAEPAMLHGAIVWLVAVPLLLGLAALGAGSYFGEWYGGLAGTPGWALPATRPIDPNAATAARNSALGAVTALLLSLIGGVIGGWIASSRARTSDDVRAR
jgi:uncharacterized membrane protein YeaQ/YmgE (transglycosylase-associated protein family)